MKLLWRNYEPEYEDLQEIPDKIVNLTYEYLRGEDGQTLANFDHNVDAWVRESDGTTYSDIEIIVDG